MPAMVTGLSFVHGGCADVVAPLRRGLEETSAWSRYDGCDYRAVTVVRGVVVVDVVAAEVVVVGVVLVDVVLVDVILVDVVLVLSPTKQPRA